MDGEPALSNGVKLVDKKEKRKRKWRPRALLGQRRPARWGRSCDLIDRPGGIHVLRGAIRLQLKAKPGDAEKVTATRPPTTKILVLCATTGTRHRGTKKNQADCGKKKTYMGTAATK